MHALPRTEFGDISLRKAVDGGRLFGLRGRKAVGWVKRSVSKGAIASLSILSRGKIMLF